MSFDIEGLTWSEKSVEYQYIADGVKGGLFDTAWPFDGGDERLGDALFRKNFRYYIIEFKRHIKFFPSEYKKFSEDGKNGEAGFIVYDAAKDALRKRGRGFHLMVSGNAKITDGKPEFFLEAYRYFDCDATDAIPYTGKIQAASEAVMEKYLREYASFKKGELVQLDPYEEDDDGTSGGRSKAAGMLVGINGNKERRVWDLRECLRLMVAPAPTPRTTPTSTI